MEAIVSLATLSLLLLSADALAARSRPSSRGARGSFAPKSDILGPQVVEAASPQPPSGGAPGSFGLNSEFLGVITPTTPPPFSGGTPGSSVSNSGILGAQVVEGDDLTAAPPPPPPSSRGTPGSFVSNFDILGAQVVEGDDLTGPIFSCAPCGSACSFKRAAPPPPFSGGTPGSFSPIESNPEPSGGGNIEKPVPEPARASSPARRRQTPQPETPEEPVGPAQVVVPAQQTQTVSTDTVAPEATAQTLSTPFDVAFSTAAPAQGQGDANGRQEDANEGQTNLLKPYAVSLRRRSDLGYFCAGVLIGRRHVLTAAHCVDFTLPGGDTQPEVVVGSARLSQTSGLGIQVISTESVHFSPETPEGQPDLAISKLARRANQRKVRLPDSADFLPNAGESLTGIGWGRTSTQSAFSDLVQFFQTTFVERDVCFESLNREIATFNLCMGGEGGGSCSGDNGGPIITERNPDLLVGIVGSQHACGQPIIDVHNSVAPSIDWIIETRRNT